MLMIRTVTSVEIMNKGGGAAGRHCIDHNTIDGGDTAYAMNNGYYAHLWFIPTVSKVNHQARKTNRVHASS